MKRTALIGETRLDVRPGANGGWDALINGRFRGNYARRSTAEERGRIAARRTEAIDLVGRIRNGSGERG